jgi:hypothetical protein
VLVNKIEISCQNRVKALNRDLTRLEYLAILRDEHFAALPEELQGANRHWMRQRRPSRLTRWRKHGRPGREWSVPLPDPSGDVRISITRDGLAENRRQGQAVLGWLAAEKLIDEAEREPMGEAIEKSTLLFPHQAYDLMLRGLREPDQEPH